MNRKFGVIIISHGRPDRVYTLDTLNKCGYTGDYVILLDDEDKTRQAYIDKFGEDHIKVFSKDEIGKRIDPFDNLPNRAVTIYARNKCWDIAKECGWTHYLELDDDYTGLTFRREVGDKLKAFPITNLDEVCEAFCDYLDSTDALTVAFAQGGDFIGGLGSAMWKLKLKRKAMNAFFCRVDRPFEFLGRMNDDVNFYIVAGQQGGLALTIADVCVIQPATQTNSGGMTESYLNNGTYIKSFYSVICCPSCAKIATMGPSNPRIHHKIFWDNCTPKILNETFRK